MSRFKEQATGIGEAFGRDYPEEMVGRLGVEQFHEENGRSDTGFSMRACGVEKEERCEVGIGLIHEAKNDFGMKGLNESNKASPTNVSNLKLTKEESIEIPTGAEDMNMTDIAKLFKQKTSLLKEQM